MKLDEILGKNLFTIALFDLDGLLVDTEAIGKKVMVELFLERFDIHLTEEDQRNFYGVPDIVCYERMIQKYGVDAIAQKLLDEHNKIYNKGIGELEEPLPGVREVLQRLQEKDIAMAVCSGSYRDQVMLILRNLDLEKYFSAVTCFEDTTLHKPNPGPYLHSIRTLNVSPQFCFAFEDSASGGTAAKRAGIYCVGVEIGNHGTQDLRHTDLVVATLRELI